MPARRIEGPLVAGVGVASYSDAGIVGKDPLQTSSGSRRAVGNDHLAGMQRVTDPNAAAVMKAHPRRSARHRRTGNAGNPRDREETTLPNLARAGCGKAWNRFPGSRVDLLTAPSQL